MGRAGLPSPTPYGFVELTPEREYLLVTEFFDGAVELGEATVDDQVIDDGLSIIRRLWHAGLAHRDIKPANLLVRDGRMLLIDVAFVLARMFLSTVNNDSAVKTSLEIQSLGCNDLEPLWLQAQAVPSTSLVPCVRTLPVGWSLGNVAVNDGRSVITLRHDRAGEAMVARLTAGWDVGQAAEQASGSRGSGATSWSNARSPTSAPCASTCSPAAV
jgi:serine/threonine protein kinase